jgi:hypothetical protein
VIVSQVNLRRNHNGGLDRQLGPHVVNHDLRRRDLLHRSLWKPAFGWRHNIVIAATTAAADNFFRNGEGVRIGGRRNQRYDLTLLDLLNNFVTEHCAT